MHQKEKATMDDFWDRIRELLRIHKLTLADLSKELNLSPSFLSVAMTRKSSPRVDFAYAVAKRFGVTINWLVTGEDPDAVNYKYAPVVKDERIMEIAYNLQNCSEDYITIIEQLVAHEFSHAKRA
jgi:transcriptional regulator with XRE-family HTH domain